MKCEKVAVAAAAAGILVAMLTACGAAVSEPRPDPGDTLGGKPELVRGIHFISGADVADTAWALLPQPLVVEVHDTAGRVAANVELQVTSTDTAYIPACAWRVPPFTPCTVPLVYLGATKETTGDVSPLRVRTDAEGRTSIAINFLGIAGEVGVIVRAASVGLADTAHFTIEPATAVRALIEPHDTTIYLGTGYKMRLGTADGNVNIVTPGGTVTADPGVALGEDYAITGTAYGVSRVVLTAGEWSDTATIRVVPHGRVATLYSNFVDAFALIDLDGSGTMLYTDLDGTPRNAGMSWSPDGTQLVYDMGGRVYVQSVNGDARRLIAEPPPGLDEEKWPSWSRDGEWIYFSGKTADNPFTIWRASVDGATVESLDPERSCCENQIHVSPSPDGARLAYISNGGIRTMDVATLSSTGLGDHGERCALVSRRYPSGVRRFDGWRWHRRCGRQLGADAELDVRLRRRFRLVSGWGVAGHPWRPFPDRDRSRHPASLPRRLLESDVVPPVTPGTRPGGSRRGSPSQPLSFSARERPPAS